MVGYPLCAPPSSWWWVGASQVGGWHDEVRWHDGGRAVVPMATPSVITDLPVCVSVPPPCCLLGGRIEWRSGAYCDAPSSYGFGTSRCSTPSLHCPVPLTSSCPSVCLLSQHCWFRVVSLCQGCVIVE